MESRNAYRSSSAEVVLDARDPIRHALALARPQTVVPVPLHATAPWGARFSPFPHIKLGAIVEGECWLCIDGLEPLFLSAGDFYLLGNPPSYGLGSSIEEARASDSNGALRKRVSASKPEIPQASVTYICSVDFEFRDSDASILFSSLPPAVLVKADDSDGRLLWNIATLLVHEFETQKVGRPLVLEHLAQILLVHMLRSHAGASHEPLGWLASVADDGIGAALRAVHADPRHHWTLEELAEIAKMSRSAFALNFRNKVGRPPLGYLIAFNGTPFKSLVWRMLGVRMGRRVFDDGSYMT
ncbi:AraC family transcriptional regulator, partial [Streptomyces minutiscleroticus]|uniref:AraC family transcriptional regulator n=1 Tax=Streptomyces minutiscleroticus TaxID=68238 RepID=UPI003325FEBF